MISLEKQLENVKKGCGSLILVDSSDKSSESWICGQYYDALRNQIICRDCNKKFSWVREIETTYTTRGKD